MNYITKYSENYIIEFMNQIISKIYPPGKKSLYPANNLYLKPVLSKINRRYKPYYYANFLSSLDGRIATYDKKYGKLLTPERIKSKVDYSLFCQLHAQSDCLVTNTEYLRGLSKGYYGNILSVKNSKLNLWRNKNNLKNQDIIVLSNSLNFPINKNIEVLKNKITILTTSNNKKKIQNLEKKKYKVIQCKGKNVSAKRLNEYIISKKFKSIYFIAGPRIVEQMISENLLNKLYCSTSMCIMGSENYDKIIRGDFLKESKNLKLVELYLYSHKTKKITQQTLFQVFDLKGK